MPVSTAEGVYVAEHSDTPAVTVATSVHVTAGANVPEPLDEKVIFPSDCLALQAP